MRLNLVDSGSRDNNLNLIRLIAAVAVTFSHSFVLLSGKNQLIWGGLLSSEGFAFVPVAVFFGLSGFLILQSFERRRSWFQFLEARWLRIFPGLFFSCLVTTILISQLVKYQGLEALLDIKNWRYTFGAFFFDYSYYDGVFDTNPTHGVNGSLWTLPIEFRMYLFVFAFGLTGLWKTRFLFPAMAVLLFALGVLHVDIVVEKVFPFLFRIRNYDGAYFRLPFSFIMGMLIYRFRDRVPINIYVATALLLANLAIPHWLLLCVSFVYAAFAFGYHPSLYMPRLNFKTDLSYGIYVLSFPIQQVLIFNGWKPEPHMFFILSMVCTLPLALMSWHLVEHPALRMKGRFAKKRPASQPEDFSPQPVPVAKLS